jgi:4-amino-4-deoxy-L-arabinose transferase-like glycosyltransferase
MQETSEIYRRLGIARADRRIDWLWLGLATVAAFPLYLWRLGNVPLRDWDEGIVATIAREIQRSDWLKGEWLFLQWLDGAPYWNKPPLLHWLVSLAYQWGGIDELTSRLPSAILSALSIPLLYCVGRELFYRRLPAIFATGVYLTYLPFVRQGRLAMLDGAIVCFWIATLACLLRSRRDLRWSLGIGIGIGLMCLTKGLVGIALGLIGLLFLLWDTPRIFRSGYFWTGLLLGFAPVIGWYYLQYQHYGPTFIQGHFFDQGFDRLGQAVEQNGQPSWFYVWEMLKYGIVWLPLIPLGIKLGWRDRSMSWVKLLTVWGGGYFLLISAMSTKLPWYAMPLYPAIALLVGVAMTYLWEPSSRWLERGIFLAYYNIWGTIYGFLLAVATIGLIYFNLVDHETDLIIVFGTLTATLTATTILAWRQSRQFMLVLMWGTYLTLMAFVGSDNWIWELAEREPIKPIAAFIQQHTTKQVPIYVLTEELSRPSFNFYSDRGIRPTQLDTLQKTLQQAKVEPGQQWTIVAPIDAVWELTQDKLRGLPNLKIQGIDKDAANKWGIIHLVKTPPKP